MNITDFLDHSYVPYSKTPTISFVESASGALFAGCMIENISYPLTIPAEQSAIYNCISEGHTPARLWTNDTQKNILSFWRDEFDIDINEIDDRDFSDINLKSVELEKDIDIEQSLKKLLDQAVVEESNFPVSALIETDDAFYSGVNIECSSWDMGLCAERVALAKAITYSGNDIKSLHIHTRYGEYSSPCGACRQVILEHMPDRKVHLHHANNTLSEHFSNDLIPYSFRSSSLTNS